jgi:UDP-glucose 4-epimerase
MRPERHLVLGGSGFLGRHVVFLLAQAGHSVTAVSRAPPTFSFPTPVADCIAWKILDLATADWDGLVAGADVVHHYAWSSVPASANANPAGDLLVNVGPILGLLDALKRRGGGRLMFASSGGTVYGRLRTVPAREDDPLAPITAYGAGKATTELYLKFYREMHGVDCRIARIANPFGAGQNLARGVGAVTAFLHHAIAGQKIVIWGDGEVVRDYIHVSDVAAFLFSMACAEKPSEFVFNVGSGTGTSLNQIIAELETCMGCPLEVERIQKRSFDVPVSVLDINRSRRVLGWSPKLSLLEGLSRAFSDLEAGLQLSTFDNVQTSSACSA